ncbi:acetyl-CoA carboxylase biotin carboxyl carrier protein [Tengunoibacter tsumagoiensis]|uniref:Biotin carboxyl carrier protein of acetyl-CoA carboxylase n=1 Tax=Tengunoibacter tsumagoiensis TaxID=2014871 RepID=A0A401ZUK3_9CHLR|nr:biotin/lipoyl-containing protein [Tengunoibacter tsumagoiensis]GCE10466.1 acetyl-CoA carboxylase, biotin carboxyl carrier protein [Tengunoibacter tsumagoiensis]
MDRHKHPSSAWLERVEEIVTVLEGSSVGELELTEDGTEIIIRRSPGMVLAPAVSEVPTLAVTSPGLPAPRSAGKPAKEADKTIPVVAPLTGVYYAAASPSTPPFASVGDIVQVGQVVALVEAMKVFNEIAAETSGRVVKMVAVSGNVVQKGDVLLRLEAL